jgi:hypothetical protein
MSKLPFSKRNYQLMAIGFAVIAFGFIVMTLDGEPHGFGVLGLTIGPVIVVSGFVLEVFAILHTPKENK